jgi:hypothetical protein
LSSDAITALLLLSFEKFLNQLPDHFFLGHIEFLEFNTAPLFLIQLSQFLRRRRLVGEEGVCGGGSGGGGDGDGGGSTSL